MRVKLTLDLHATNVPYEQTIEVVDELDLAVYIANHLVEWGAVLLRDNGQPELTLKLGEWASEWKDEKTTKVLTTGMYVYFLALTPSWNTLILAGTLDAIEVASE